MTVFALNCAISASMIPVSASLGMIVAYALLQILAWSSELSWTL